MMEQEEIILMERQANIIKSKERIVVIHKYRGGGSSFALITLMKLLLLKENTTTYVLSKTRAEQVRYIEELKELDGTKVFLRDFKVTHIKNNSNIRFISNTADLIGSVCDNLIITDTTYSSLLSNRIDTHRIENQIFLEIELNINIKVITMEMKDNPFFSDEYKKINKGEWIWIKN